MRYLLDTSVCIQYLTGRSKTIEERLETIGPDAVALCSIVKAELTYGALKSRWPERNLRFQNDLFSRFASFPFADKAAIHAGRIRMHLSSQGIMIGSSDLQIAAIAVANNLIVVTHNTREFSRVPDLKVVDWETDKAPKGQSIRQEG